MTSAEAKLTAVVLTAQELSPQIVHNVIKARHGAKLDRPAHLRRAIEQAEQLVDQLKTAETVLGWRKRDAA